MIASINKNQFFKITFFAAIVLLTETVLFHVLNYIHDYYAATLVISLAILGIGLGAFSASVLKISENYLFLIACLGSWLCLFTGLAVILFYPALWICAIFIAPCFFFPVLYISAVFREQVGSKVYFYDMGGAFLGVVLCVMLYKILPSETIILLILLIISLTGFLSVLFSNNVSGRYFMMTFFLISLAGCALLYEQLLHDSFNIYDTLKRITKEDNYGIDKEKAFRVWPMHPRVKTYDNLQGRIDILRWTKTTRLDERTGKLVKREKPRRVYIVSYEGYGNDSFTEYKSNLYDYYNKKQIKYPTKDIRVMYGITEAPKIFVTGSAASGIMKSIIKLTPLENIHPVELNPGIIKAMKKDFYLESGEVYKGLEPVFGNAISILKATDKKFDIITLLNTHSSRSIGFPGPPDFLHTAETYNLYFEHLTDDGYLLLEERPFNNGGKLGTYRLLNTMWQALKQRGASDPSSHFMLWEWMGPYDRPLKRSGSLYYISGIVSLNPLVGEKREKIKDWINNVGQFDRYAGSRNLLYLKNHSVNNEWAELFEMIESGNFGRLEKEKDFNSAIVTNDRPFPQVGTKSFRQINDMALYIGITCFTLWSFFTFSILTAGNRIQGMYLNVFNVLIGAAYFLIEIILIQIYQNIFISPTSSMVLVLGFLLLSSGVGGLYSAAIKPWYATSILILLLVGAIYLPTLLIQTGISLIYSKILCILFICVCGFFMGTYFPKGLQVAKEANLKSKIPQFFAINSIAGSFAVVAALFLGIKIGYMATMGIAVFFYLFAGLLLNFIPVAITSSD